MRGMVRDLETPMPLVTRLPGVYQDSDFTARFVAAFDDGIAPIFATLDNLAAHFDSSTAPADLLAYVGSWVGARREHADDVAMRRVRFHPEQQVRRGQVEEVQHVRLEDLPVVHQPAHLVGRGCEGV